MTATGDQIITADICVIGAGSGGLSVAAGAAQLGAKTVLIEKGPMGGDCLNVGCVPSKALLAAAHRVHDIRTASAFGVNVGEVQVDFAAVHDHVHDVIATIAPHDSVERFEGLGVRVIKGTASFVSAKEVVVAGQQIVARRFVIAAGSSAMVPPIPGLGDVPYLTNETIFSLTSAPERLVVLGGGPIGIEMAQAFSALGSKVTVVEMANILPRDDADLVVLLRQRLLDGGIEIHEQARASAVRREDNQVIVTIEREGQREEISASHLLVAAGRRANTQGLNLEAAGIVYEPSGIVVDRRLRTSNRRVFALGDVIAPSSFSAQFTHVAGYHAGIVIRNALFKIPARADLSALPWVTYSDPELAQVGLTQTQAIAAYGAGKVTVLTRQTSQNDRATAQRDGPGLLKIMVGPRGKILGASMLGAQAGELIAPIILAMSQGLKIGALASYMAPYPSRGEMVKHCAGSFYTPKLFSPLMKALVRFLSFFG